MRAHLPMGAAAILTALLVTACGGRPDRTQPKPTAAERTLEQRRNLAATIRRNSRRTEETKAPVIITADPRAKARQSMQAVMARRWREAQAAPGARQGPASAHP